MKKYLYILLIIILVFTGALLIYKKSIDKASTSEQITNQISKKYNKPQNEVFVEVTTDTGKFSKGTVRFSDQTGGIWFAAKTFKGWELAFDGNGMMPCEAANKYNFPIDIVPQCIDKANSLINRR